MADDIGALLAFTRARLDELEAIVRDKRYVWPTHMDFALNPEQVLRDIEAKRRILAAYEDDDGSSLSGLYHAVVALAAIWDDHPDYPPRRAL